MKTLSLLLSAIAGALAAVGVVSLLQPRIDATPREVVRAPEQPNARHSARRAAYQPGPVRVAGLMIQRPLAAETEYGESLPFKGSFAHTRLALELARPEGGIVSLRREECRLTRFEDDRGTSLLPSASHENGFEMLPEVAPDGSSIALVLASEVHPAPAAVTVTAAGEIVLLVASEKAIATGEETELEAGATLEVGPFSFELEEVGPSEWSEAWSIRLKTEVDLAQVVRFALVDAAGEEVELSQGSSWSGMGQWSQSLECERTFERAALRIEYWSDPRVERVPFDLQADVGLR